jgi:hypothetical protein
MQSIMEVIDLMAEHNPGLLIMQIGEQLDEFKERVTVLADVVQQLQRLAIDLLTLEQMAILHQSVLQKDQEEGSRGRLQCSSNKVIRLLPYGDHKC